MTKKFGPSEIPRYLTSLENTIIRLEEISARMDDSELAESSLEGEWSILQILAHISACQDVWAYSIYAMLSVKSPELFPFHPRQMAATMKYDELSFSDLFSHFRSGRKQLLRILQNLTEQKWQQEALINSRYHSVFSQVRRMALHEADHWEQIDKSLE